MSPKKKRWRKEGRAAPRAPLLCCARCLQCGQHAGAKRTVLPPASSSSSSNSTFVQIIWHRLAVSFQPHGNSIHCETCTHLIHQKENLLGCAWIWFGDDQRGGGRKDTLFLIKKERGLVSVAFSDAFAERVAVYLNKGFCSPWRDERRTSPFTSASHKADTALLWNTTSLVPCSRVCSSNGVLRRPICLADHCLFDVAANVTFLFQSKTQQGVPSVWHSLHSLPRCLFVQILHGNLHESFIPWFWSTFSARFYFSLSLWWVSSVFGGKKRD